MNNGKVRIYELSKELNLDNKELLAICDQLSIAVKSHSSTITELDAERIRTTAMKVAITTNVMPKQDRTSQINYSDDSASSPNQVDANKQKILEIRRPPKIQLKDSINPAPRSYH
ncbi:Translation initiation factor 2 [Richelia intracellularis HM01]|nr:Translation initiation factor 2 [Richelia intracellularis HM01]